jgi:flagellar motor switch protein FliG
MTVQDEFLRKAAVLITTLDDQAAESLLEVIGREQSVRLRRMLTELAPVTLDERSQIIQEFLHASEANAGGIQDAEGVEVDDSLAAKIASSGSLASDDESPDPSPTSPVGARAEASPFSFLLAEEAQVLAGLLADERAQTISIVLSHLPSIKAAEVLQQLPAVLRSDVIQRWGRLQGIDHQVVAEIAEQLRLGWQRRSRKSARPKAASNVSPRSEQPRRGRTAARSSSSGTSPRPIEPETRATTTSHEGQVVMEFDDLNALGDRALALVFQHADPHVALIALTGASPKLLDRIQRQLPWHEARELRHQMERLGPIRLSDVELAQRKLAETAAALIRDKIISPPKNCRFTTAA